MIQICLKLDLVKIEVHELGQPPDLFEVLHCHFRLTAVECVSLNQSPQLLVDPEPRAERRLCYG